VPLTPPLAAPPEDSFSPDLDRAIQSYIEALYAPFEAQVMRDLGPGELEDGARNAHLKLQLIGMLKGQRIS
jgi:hypothetical protein